MHCANHPDEDAPYNCYYCRSPICVDCESKLNGPSICPKCLAQIRRRAAERRAAEIRDVNHAGAILCGALAAATAACLWSQLALWTGGRLPAGALVLGAAVGYTVILGAGGKRGHSLQQIASITALVGIVSAHLLTLLHTGGVAHAFPQYLASLGALDWLSVALGVACAYWLPHVRSLPEQP